MRKLNISTEGSIEMVVLGLLALLILVLAFPLLTGAHSSENSLDRHFYEISG